MKPPSPLCLEEWHFEIPNDQIEYCWWYEYARESASLKKAVSRFREIRSRIRNKHERDDSILGAALRLQLGILAICDQFPEIPWRKIKNADRVSKILKYRAELGESEICGFRVLDPEEHKYRIQAFIILSKATKGLSRDQNGKPEILEGLALKEDFFCEIDWSVDKEQIISSFEHWLRARPQVKRAKDRSIRTKSEELKALGILRLLRFFCAAGLSKNRAASRVIELTQEINGEPVYENERSVIEASERAKKSLARVEAVSKRK